MKSYLQLLLFGIATLSTEVVAQSPTLKVRTTTSSEVSQIKVSTKTRITFSNDSKQMIISENGADSPFTFNVDEIVNMTFTIDSSGNVPETTLEDLKISYANDILTITGQDPINYAVWNINGIQIFSGYNDSNITLDMSTLAQGIYVVKANNQTLKFVKH